MPAPSFTNSLQASIDTKLEIHKQWPLAILYAAPCSTVILPTHHVFPPHSNARCCQTPKLTSFLPHAVPGSSQRFLDKSRSLAADCVAYDLEDSVTPHMKAEARGLVRRAIDQPTPTSIRERAVRINSVDSGLALGDLTEVVRIDLSRPIQWPEIA